MKNPKDNIFNNWMTTEKQNQADLVKEKAQAAALYADLTYGQQYQTANRTNKFLKLMCNGASSITGALAIWLAMSFLMGFYVAAIIAGILSILFELRKNHYNTIGFKYLLKYKDRRRAITWPMAMAAIISMALAIIGAIQAPKLNPAPAPNLKLAISLDSINIAHQEHIQEATLAAAKIWNMHKKPRDKNDLSKGYRWSTHKSAQKAKNLHAEKSQLIIDEKRELNQAIQQAKQSNKATQEHNLATEKQSQKDHQNNLLLGIVLLVILSIFLELFYYYLCFEIAFYLLRVDIDNRPEHYQDGQLEELQNKSFFGVLSGKEQNLNSMQINYSTPNEPPKTPNVMTPSVKTPNVKTPKKINPGQAVCELKECSKVYEYTRKSQKYCSAECRKTAHLKRKLQERLDIINK